MKTLLALVALCLVSLALVPPAQAHIAPPRDDLLVGCQSDFGGGRALAVPIAVGVLCVDASETWCTLWIEWTAIPQTPTCLVAPFGAAAASVEFPWPGGQTPDVQCMDVYSETQLVGGYWLVRRDSCSAEVYWCPEGSSPPGPPCQEGVLTTSAAAAPAVQVPPYYCFPYERRIEAGPITVIQGGCGNDVRLCDDGDGGSSLLAIRDAGDIKALDTDCIDDLVTLQCSDIYARHEVGPVAIVVTSGCSGHVELCGTPVHQRVDLSCIGLAVDTPPVNCLPYQREISLAPGVTIMQGGCGSYVVLCGTRVTADPSSIDPSCLLTTTTAVSAEPNCLQMYRETHLGPVTVVQRDSCHSETYVCEDDDGVHESDETLKAFLNGQTTQPDHAVLQDCVRDTLGDYIAWSSPI